MTNNGMIRQSPLHGRQECRIDPRLFAMREIPFTTKINIRGNGDDQTWQHIFHQECGLSVPHEPNQLIHHDNGAYVFWLGPNEWLVSASNDQNRECLERACANAKSQNSPCAVTDVSDSRTIIEVSGQFVREVLNKGCPLNFGDRHFPEQTVAQSYVGHAFILCHRLHDNESPIYHLYVLNSFAVYVWDYLTDAAKECQGREQYPVNT